MRSALVLLLAALLAAPSALSLGDGDETLGYTSWDCNDRLPYGWVRADQFATQQTREALGSVVHELQHTADAWRIRSCQSYNDSLQSPEFRLRLEARAFCAEARWYVRFGVIANDSIAIARNAVRLSGSRLYRRHFQLTQAEAEREIRRACAALDFEAAFTSERN